MDITKGPNVMKSGRNSLTFPWKILTPSSESKSTEQAARTSCYFGLLFDPEDRSNVFLRNVTKLLPDYTALYPNLIHLVLLSVFWTLSIFRHSTTGDNISELNLPPKPFAPVYNIGQWTWSRKLIMLQIWLITSVFDPACSQ
jgi:hypothetical protein